MIKHYPPRAAIKMMMPIMITQTKQPFPSEGRLLPELEDDEEDEDDEEE